MLINQILTPEVASITDLKRDPMNIALAGSNGAIAILNRNRPAFYCITPELFSYFQELAENQELNHIADQRLASLDPVEVSLDDL